MLLETTMIFKYLAFSKIAMFLDTAWIAKCLAFSSLVKLFRYCFGPISTFFIRLTSPLFKLDLVKEFLHKFGVDLLFYFEFFIQSILQSFWIYFHSFNIKTQNFQVLPRLNHNWCYIQFHHPKMKRGSDHDWFNFPQPTLTNSFKFDWIGGHDKVQEISKVLKLSKGLSIH
jgi:hypothetical protein